MIKEIDYHGFTCAKNDRDCDDGDLALALNVLPENGALVGIGAPGEVGLNLEGVIGTWLHETTNYKHYIYSKKILDEEGKEHIALYWAYKDDSDEWHKTEDEERDPIYTFEEDEEILSVVFIGNTMIVSTSVNMYYFICKRNEEEITDVYCQHKYVFLDNKIPNIDIQFALSNYVIQKTFPNTGITKDNLWQTETGKSKEITEEQLEEFLAAGKSLGGVNFNTTSSAEEEDRTFSFPNNVQLKANQQYLVWTDSSFRRTTDANTGTHISKIEIFGALSEDGESTTRIATLDGSGSFYEFYAYHDYYNIKFIVTLPSGGAINDVLFLAEGPNQGSQFFSGSYWIEYTMDNYTAVMGCINKFVKEQSLDKNRFIFPFFIRYALRLYDSSLCKLSPPILMMPNTAYVPFVHCNTDDDKSDTGQDLNLYAFAADLQYKLLSAIDDCWKDLIQGVEIYASSPIYPYSQDEAFDSNERSFGFKSYVKSDLSGNGDWYVESDDLINFSYGFGQLKDAVGNVISKDYTLNNLTAILYKQFGFANSFTRIILAAAKDEDKIDEEIKNVSNFYHIKTINLEDLSLKTDFEDITLEDGALATLATREALRDEEISYENIIGGKLYTYNNRLHIYGGELIYRGLTEPCIQKAYLDSTTPNSFVDEKDGVVIDKESDLDINPQERRSTTAYVYIRTNEGVVITTSEVSGFIDGGPEWLFYPDSRAFKVLMLSSNRWNGYRSGCSFELSQHPFLNGAYCYQRKIKGVGTSQYFLPPTDAELKNKTQSSSIYVSEVNNPFTFFNSTAITAGNGNILAMAAATQAMSQGQFGQFPLYAFTDEGVWALEVNSDGTYLSSKPISRDVCINIAGVTSIDSSVIFPTARGIMEASGSRVECISDALDGRSFLDVTLLPHYQELLDKAGLDATVYKFKEFLSTCHCIYDYANQRLFFYSPGNNMAYVLSLKDAAWGMACINISSEINSYPGALGIDSDGDVIDFSQIDESRLIPFVVITRPLKLDGKDTFKMVSKVYQRGFFRHGHFAQVLWGSRDLFSWLTIGESKTDELTSLRGSGYKYLRIGIVGFLSIDESLSGATMETEEKLTNKVR